MHPNTVIIVHPKEGRPYLQRGDGTIVRDDEGNIIYPDLTPGAITYVAPTSPVSFTRPSMWQVLKYRLKEMFA